MANRKTDSESNINDEHEGTIEEELHKTLCPIQMTDRIHLPYVNAVINVSTKEIFGLFGKKIAYSFFIHK